MSRWGRRTIPLRSWPRSSVGRDGTSHLALAPTAPEEPLACNPCGSETALVAPATRTPERLSIEKCRELLPGCGMDLDDNELVEVRDQLYRLVEAVLDARSSRLPQG